MYFLIAIYNFKIHMPFDKYRTDFFCFLKSIKNYNSLDLLNKFLLTTNDKIEFFSCLTRQKFDFNL